MGNVTQSTSRVFRNSVRAFGFLQRMSLLQRVPGTTLLYAVALMGVKTNLPFSFSRVKFLNRMYQ